MTHQPDDSSAASAPTFDRIVRHRRWLLPACILGFVLIGHAQSLPSGLYLDDHAHFQHLREGDWSLASAVASAELGILGEVMDLWGGTESGLRFFRPVAFWLLKLEYTIGGWRPLPMHVFSLAWHFVCSCLVAALAWRCLGSWFWSGVAGCLMAIHPGHTATVYWIACQTELMTTTFLIGAILLYARFAGWGQRWFFRDADETLPADNCGAWWAGIGAMMLYMLALGCRENALLFPLVCISGDVLIGRRKWRWLRWEYFGLAACAFVYFVVRHWSLGGFQMPRKPYLMPVTDPEFPMFAVHKVVYTTLGLFGYVPIVPMGGRAYLASQPLLFYGSFALVILILLLIWWAFAFRRSMIWPLTWIAFLAAPTLPVFASSHHLYLPSVGAILLLSAGLAALGGLIPRGEPKIARPRHVVAAVVLSLHGIGLGLMTWATGFAYLRGTLVEDIVIKDVIERGPTLQEGDHLFFINMPLLAYYAIPALETELGIDNLYGHVLTFSPDLSHMAEPGEVEIRGQTITVRPPEGRLYFSGIPGATLLQSMGIWPMPKPGDVFKTDPFSVHVREGSAEGLAELEFVFHDPLDAPNHHFFVGSPYFLAYPLLPTRDNDDSPIARDAP